MYQATFAQSHFCRNCLDFIKILNILGIFEIWKRRKGHFWAAADSFDLVWPRLMNNLLSSILVAWPTRKLWPFYLQNGHYLIHLDLMWLACYSDRVWPGRMTANFDHVWPRSMTCFNLVWPGCFDRPAGAAGLDAPHQGHLQQVNQLWVILFCQKVPSLW